MANIKITVEGPLMDGHKVTFKAPCNCDVVEKLDVRYIENNTQKSKLFTMKDAHGNDLTGLGNLFYKNAYVDVVLDPNSGSAYLQNAGTNAYLEERLKTAGTPVDNLESDRADLPLSARQGKILNESLGEDENGMTVHEKLDNLLNRVGYDVTAIYEETLLAMTTNNLSYAVPEDGNYLFVLNDRAGGTDTSTWIIKHNGVLIDGCISRSLKIASNSDYCMKTAICSLSCNEGDIISSNYCSPYSIFNVFKLS